MSLYIKGLDMPLKGHCKIVIIHNDGEVQDFYSRDKVGSATSVPPHGNLKDADEIDFGMAFVGGSSFARECREAAQRVVDSAPTVIPADEAEG